MLMVLNELQRDWPMHSKHILNGHAVSPLHEQETWIAAHYDGLHCNIEHGWASVGYSLSASSVVRWAMSCPLARIRSRSDVLLLLR